MNAHIINSLSFPTAGLFNVFNDDDSGHDSFFSPELNSTAITGPEEDYVASNLETGYSIVPRRPKTLTQVVTVCKTDFSTGFWSADATDWTPTWVIKDGSLTRISFVARTKGLSGKDYESWFMVFNQSNNGEPGGEILVARSDVHSAPKPASSDDGSVASNADDTKGDSNNGSWSSCGKYVMTPSYTYDYSAFKSVMDECYVVVDIFKNGAVVDVNMTLQTYDGGVYTSKYQTAGYDCGFPGGDVVVRMTSEHAYMQFDVANCWQKASFIDGDDKKVLLPWGDRQIEEFQAPEAAELLEIDETLVDNSSSTTDLSASEFVLGSLSNNSLIGDAQYKFKLAENDKVIINFVNYGGSAKQDNYVVKFAGATIYANAYLEEGKYNSEDEDKIYCGAQVTKVDTIGFADDEFNFVKFMAEANVKLELIRTGKAYKLISTATDPKDDSKKYVFEVASSENTECSDNMVETMVLTNQASHQIIKDYTEFGARIIEAKPFENFYVALGAENLLNVSSVTVNGVEQAGLAKNGFQPSGWNAIGEFIKVKVELGQTASFVFKQPTQGVNVWNSWGIVVWDGFEDYTKSLGNFFRADNWLNDSKDAGFSDGLYNGGGQVAGGEWSNGWTYETQGKLLPTDKNVKISVTLSAEGATTLLEQVEIEEGTWQDVYTATLSK